VPQGSQLTSCDRAMVRAFCSRKALFLFDALTICGANAGLTGSISSTSIKERPQRSAFPEEVDNALREDH